jgi:hypothetical protein
MSAPLYSGAPWIASLTCPGSATGGSGSGSVGPIGPPGPKGDQGDPGNDGGSGSNAFTTTSGDFIQPAVGVGVLINVTDSSWMAVGQVVYINTGGYYKVFNKPNTESVIVTNLGYSGNAAVGALVSFGRSVAPAGIAGVPNGGIYAGTQAELTAQNPSGPAIWILTDSDPAYQIIPIPA